MKTAIVPAQVTTVEDRLAGNLTISQLLLMVAGLGLATMIYFVVTPKFHISITKGILMGVVAITAGGLSIRIMGKIVADWLVILTRFSQRPRRYVFTKNDRELPPVEVQQKTALQPQPAQVPATVTQSVTTQDQSALDDLLKSPSVSVRFVVAEKGGINVSLTPLKR